MAEEIPLDLEQLKKERDEYLNGWKRAKADLLNYQKEEARRMEELIKYANSGLIKELISVLDSFELALSVMESQGKSEKGIHQIKSQLEESLKRSGVEKIAVALGSPFDANFQESIIEEESDKPVSTILAIIEQGYTLSGRVIRPARVKVAKEPSETK